MTTKIHSNQRRNFIWLLIVAGIFITPYLSAQLLYRHGAAWLGAATNHGKLISSPPNLQTLKYQREPQLARHKWLLIYKQTHDCQQQCMDNLKMLNQLQAAFTKNSRRIEYGLLISNEQLAAVQQQQLMKSLPQLRFLFSSQQELDRWSPILSNTNAYYIADPHGNVILSYPSSSEPKALYDDLTRLLQASRIG